MRDFSNDHRWLSINTATIRKSRGADLPLPAIIEACARLQHDTDFRLLFKDKKEKDMTVVPPLVWKHGLQRFVEYIPRLSVEELRRLYNSAQIVVSPSLYEGFGLPAAEAMACGTPVIATTAGAFPEFIEDGRTGILVPPGDPAALAAAIKSLLHDPERCLRMGAAASEHIRTNFTWERTTRMTVDLYREVLEGGRSTEGHREPMGNGTETDNRLGSLP